MTRNQVIQRYGKVAMGFHWLMLIGLAVAFGMAWIMTDIPGITPLKLKLFNYHKWLGVTLFALVVLRLLWRQVNPPPALPNSMSTKVQLVAHAGHGLLYLFMIAIPVVGYLYSLAAGYPVVWFGVIELPVIMAPNPELKPVFKQLHDQLGNGLLLLVAGHVCMALKHHVIDKDGTLCRMVPGLKPMEKK